MSTVERRIVPGAHTGEDVGRLLTAIESVAETPPGTDRSELVERLAIIRASVRGAVVALGVVPGGGGELERTATYLEAEAERFGGGQ